MKKITNIVRNTAITVLILFAALVLGVLLQNKLGITEHVTTTFAFAVFLISLTTQGYFYGILASFIGTIAINYVFTFPYLDFNFTIPANLISAIVMGVIAVLTSALTTKVKQHEAMKAESEKERMRANLLRAISHDLRTPLTTIYGSSTALLENRDSLTWEQQEQMLLGIREDADWLVRMVENLLSITRIDSGRVQLDKMPVVLDELLDVCVGKFKKRYPDQDLILDIPDEILLIPMDAMLMEQVICNILENAVVHARGMTELILRVYPQREQAVFEILDNGCGIQAEKLPRIFTGCDTGNDQPADGRKRNMGIGLSVCATIIKAHGGTIEAENRPEGGAAFRFALDMEETGNEQ